MQQLLMLLSKLLMSAHKHSQPNRNKIQHQIPRRQIKMHHGDTQLLLPAHPQPSPPSPPNLPLQISQTSLPPIADHTHIERC
jgi:hypothetical protein